jgi:predicted phosphodiesterase
MKLRILSDLHIDDNRDYKIVPNEEDILILAGDISDNPEDTFSLISKYMKDSNYSKKVIFVMGNHDFFNDTIIERIKYWKHFGKQLGKNFHFLNQTSVIIDNIEFYGTTLWSNINVNNNINNRFSQYKDFNCIYNYDIFTPITPNDYKKMHLEQKNNLILYLNKPSKYQRVIITHHLPSYKSISKKYKNNVFNDMFAGNLDYVIENNAIALWIHGHTHSSVDYTIENTRILCNPKGKDDENPEFKDNFIVEIENVEC